jgi:hypothetical protein
MITAAKPSPNLRQTQQQLLPARNGQALSSGVLNVVVLYESFRDGVRVRKALDRISWATGRVIRFDVRGWDFASIGGTDEPGIALANGADILIVSMRADKALPPPVMRWVEDCVADNADGPSILVGTSGATLTSSSVLSSSLGAIAEKWHLHSFSCEHFANQETRDLAVKLLSRKPGGGRFTDAASYAAPRYDCMGINE